MLDLDPSCLHLVSYVEVSYVEVSCASDQGALTVDLESFCCLVVMVECGRRRVALCLNEVVGPLHARDEVVNANKLGLSRAPCVGFLFL